MFLAYNYWDRGFARHVILAPCSATTETEPVEKPLKEAFSAHGVGDE